MLTLAAASDGDETFALLDRIHAVVHQYYPTDSYLVGDAMSAYGSEQTFTQDNVMVSAMSILMVMLVLLFSFRSLGMPILLTLVIQGSIWINFGITVLAGEYVLFMVYLVASAIQMGCNVDYAIVVASHYTEARADQGPREAMITALNLAFPTIITSGTMLISAGLLIGARVSSGALAGMGRHGAGGDPVRRLPDRHAGRRARCAAHAVPVRGAGAARAGVRGRRAHAPAARAAGAVRRRERKNRGAGSCLHPGFAFAPRCVIMGHHGRKELRSQWSKCSLSATAVHYQNPETLDFQGLFGIASSNLLPIYYF